MPHLKFPASAANGENRCDSLLTCRLGRFIAPNGIDVGVRLELPMRRLASVRGILDGGRGLKECGCGRAFRRRVTMTGTDIASLDAIAANVE